MGRSSALVSTSRACLVLLLNLYQITPTKRSFDESHVENSLLDILRKQQISLNETLRQEIVNEALQDDTNADGGWSIFSIAFDDDDDESKSGTSSSSMMSSGGSDPILSSNMDYHGSFPTSF